MALSALDLFSIGIGPSSSHTVGPMRAAARFVDGLRRVSSLGQVRRVTVQLFGSLAATGVGHGTDRAVVLGLTGADPETVDVAAAFSQFDEICDTRRLLLGGEHAIDFDAGGDVEFHRKPLPRHPNGMRFTAYGASGATLAEAESYSVGGGFVVDRDAGDGLGTDDVAVQHPFTRAAELLAQCSVTGGSIADVMLANEAAFRPESETREQLLRIWAVMQECVENGCTREEKFLPGRLRVRRRAPELRRDLRADEADERARTGTMSDPLWAMEWVNLYALAVNEENASGGRVVTAPTNGAAGIVPAVLHYFTRFVHGADDDAVVTFLLTAAAIGILFKERASISGAEVGCQGEVGSACSMAAAGLCAVLGGTPVQVENAAEIGIEHNLGLTCDPVGGLVQVPCIERNAIASVKAINAARLALHGDGDHRVGLDAAIRTMRQTGRDMKSKYKETSRGGLAVNVVEC
ncbi:L-serine dehydratase [Flexivirga endophytica]|uniref:L-serine dehydratase n=1 Tax=Flexivirga endophytica TaxID=1849103 RepID=A0A916T0Y0_9MICO|nr:L-serine ammonia-lyase [Flexivirga endophytica]GGB25545.1 L-serine dehydratase [Flexivirga endophytica]GHB54123.1 L-serine dehydratase [Flexivirga endophytica]